MRDIDIAVDGASPIAHSAVPTLAFALRLTESAGEAVDTVALQAQIQLEVARRRYSAREQEALLDLFGDPARWGRTLRTMLWTHVTVIVPRFVGSTVVQLPVACPTDLGVAAGKYFHALEAGVVPLNLQFSGTVFYAGEDGALLAAPIPWSREARYALPVAAWRAAVDEHHPDSGWIRLPSAMVDRLHRHRARRGLPTWEAVLDELLDAAEEVRAGQARDGALGNGRTAAAIGAGGEPSGSGPGV